MDYFSTMRLRDLVLYNPWWEDKKKGLRYLFNKSFNFSFIAHRNTLQNVNYMIRGPRQVGKTIFLYRNIFEYLKNGIEEDKIVYISCDRLSGIKELRNIVRELVFLRGSLILFLDEVTSLRDWYKVYKEFSENEKITCIATGSRPLELERYGEFFPGRGVNIINFYPLSFSEFIFSICKSLLDYEVRVDNTIFSREFYRESLLKFLDKNNIDYETISSLFKIFNKKYPDFKSALNYTSKFFEPIYKLFNIFLGLGGYPISVEKKIFGEEQPFEIIVQDTLGTIEKEGLDIHILNALIPILLQKLGSRISFNKIAREIEVDVKTVIKYINVLERSFLIRVISYCNGKIRRKKEKKIYFSDPFIIRALSNYYGIKALDKSIIAENILIEEACRKVEKPFIRDYRSYLGYGKIGGKEVDLILNFEGRSIKIELKYEEKVEDRKYLDIILTKDEMRLSRKPYFIPLPLFLLIFDFIFQGIEY